MLKAFISKEWIKTRWYLLAAFITITAFAAYSVYGIFRAVSIRGAGHIWEVMVTRDAVFIDIIQYVPLIAGVLLSIFQFTPEMQRKCLKLTLHLPVPAMRSTYVMIGFGMAALSVCFTAALLTISIPATAILPKELAARMVSTALPWFLAGYCGYTLAIWIILEPSWKARTAWTFISVLILRIFFLAPAPAAYGKFLPWLALSVILSASLAWLSVTRFKAGRQD